MEGIEGCTESSWQSTIAGGFVRVRMWELAAVWTAYSATTLKALDVRVWLAVHEMVGRREAAYGEKGRSPVFGMGELRGLVGRGVKETSLRAALRRLERVGVVRARHKSVVFARCLDEVLLADPQAALDMLALFPMKRSWFPLPRRMLRVLCAGAKKSVMATVFMQSAYCLYRNGSAWTEEGRVKASRVAKAFSLSTKSIYRAREHLVEIGFLARVGGYPAWATKLYGERLAVNVSWSREVAVSELSTDGEFSTGKKSTRPYQAPSSSKRTSNNQDPARAAGPAGACSESGRTHEAPSWRTIKREDLESTGRRLGLYESAVSTGAVSGSEASKLNFLAACERARHRGTSNPCGLLRWLVEQNQFQFVTADEEDAARKALRAFEGHSEGPHEAEGEGNGRGHANVLPHPMLSVAKCMKPLSNEWKQTG